MIKITILALVLSRTFLNVSNVLKPTFLNWNVPTLQIWIVKTLFISYAAEIIKKYFSALWFCLNLITWIHGTIVAYISKQSRSKHNLLCSKSKCLLSNCISISIYTGYIYHRCLNNANKAKVYYVSYMLYKYCILISAVLLKIGFSIVFSTYFFATNTSHDKLVF